MIDRDDMLELTRRMTLTRNCFDRIAGAYVDEMGEVEDTFNIHFGKLSASEKTNAPHLSVILYTRIHVASHYTKQEEKFQVLIAGKRPMQNTFTARLFIRL